MFAVQQDPWVRPGLAYSHFPVEDSRGNNDANLMVLGTKVLGDDQALALVDLWWGRCSRAGSTQTGWR